MNIVAGGFGRQPNLRNIPNQRAKGIQQVREELKLYKKQYKKARSHRFSASGPKGTSVSVES